MFEINAVDPTEAKSAMTDKSPKTNITVAVEGNIGSGKTTLLNHFRKNPMIDVLEEPVAEWQNVGGENLLELFYTNGQRWSYLFQTYTLLSLLKIHKKPHVTSVKMMERSIYSGFYCFAHNLRKNEMMSSVEYSVHHEWFDWITKTQQPRLDLIIYLRTSPETCMQRVRVRSRTEEKKSPHGTPLRLTRQTRGVVTTGKISRTCSSYSRGWQQEPRRDVTVLSGQ